MSMDVVDYKIEGSDMQYVELELDPGEAVVAEAGAMLYMDDDIEMETVFGDGSTPNSSVLDKLVGAGKRLVTGATLFTTVFHNRGQEKRHVAFAAPYPGKIVPVHLAKMGGTLICAKDSFLCAARGVNLGMAFQRRIGAGFFGGDGFIMQRLDGDGVVFIHAGGTLITRGLRPGANLNVDAGCVVAFQPSVEFDIKYVGNIKSALFGGEGLFFAQLTGPGIVWLQSMPLSRLANRLAVAAPHAAGQRPLDPLGAVGSVAGGNDNSGSSLLNIAGSLVGGIFSGDDKDQ